MKLSFEKMEGLGNDFIVVEDFDEAIHLSKQQVIALCDRNFGIGADGIILLRPSTQQSADYAWWFANADGSLAEMCGNGIRCAARALYDHGHLQADASQVVIDTAIGPRRVGIATDTDGTFVYATVDMGSATLAPEKIGTSLEANTSLEIACSPESIDAKAESEEIKDISFYVEGIIDYPLEIEGLDESIEVTCLSMGNPHTVIDVASLSCTIADAPVDVLGPRIENHPAFSHRTNVGFMEVIDEDTMNARVWERGCGETLACGTGACAAAVSAYLHGKIGEAVTVRVLGGDLKIAIDPMTLAVNMAGPACFVYSGTIELDNEGEK